MLNVDIEYEMLRKRERYIAVSARGLPSFTLPPFRYRQWTR
jgi:hypothetical protein